MTVSVYPPRSAQAYANAACTKTHHQHRCSGAAKIHEATESQATEREVEGQQADAHRMPHRLPSPRSIHPLPAPPVPHVGSLAVSHLTHSYNKKDKTQGMHGAQVSHIPPCSLVDGSTDARQGGGSGATVVAKGGTARVSNGPSCPLSTNTARACASSSPRCAPVCLHASLIPKKRTQMLQSSRAVSFGWMLAADLMLLPWMLAAHSMLLHASSSLHVFSILLPS